MNTDKNQVEQTSKIYPNSCQIPNIYLDQYMAFLTGEEWKVLSYTVRRTMGFRKYEDQISLSQYASGLRSREGKQLDNGTGLSKPAINTAITKLLYFGLIIQTNPSNGNEGASYALQLDDALIDHSKIMERHNALMQKNKSRTKTMRSKRAETRAVSGTERSKTKELRSVGLNGSGQSDITRAVSGTDTQKKVESQGKKDSAQPANAVVPAADQPLPAHEKVDHVAESGKMVEQDAEPSKTATFQEGLETPSKVPLKVSPFVCWQMEKDGRSLLGEYENVERAITRAQNRQAEADHQHEPVYIEVLQDKRVVHQTTGLYSDTCEWCVGRGVTWRGDKCDHCNGTGTVDVHTGPAAFQESIALDPQPEPEPKEKSSEKREKVVPGDKVYYRYRTGWGGGETAHAAALVCRVMSSKAEIVLVDHKHGVAQCVKKTVELTSLDGREVGSQYDEKMAAFVEQAEPLTTYNPLPALPSQGFRDFETHEGITPAIVKEKLYKHLPDGRYEGPYPPNGKLVKRGGLFVQGEVVPHDATVIAPLNIRGAQKAAQFLDSVGRQRLPPDFQEKALIDLGIKWAEKDVDAACLGECIAAWLDANTVAPSIAWTVGEITVLTRLAWGICNAGYIADDVRDYVKAKIVEKDNLGRQFWRDKAVPFGNVADNLGAWKASKKPTPNGKRNRLQPNPNCPDCKGLGYISFKNEQGKMDSYDCACVKEQPHV